MKNCSVDFCLCTGQSCVVSGDENDLVPRRHMIAERSKEKLSLHRNQKKSGRIRFLSLVSN